MIAATMNATHSEQAIRDNVVRRLIADGYDVLVEPGPDQLPVELAHFRPDILARRGDENLIVEIKRQFDRLAAGQIEAMARAVWSKPGWSFELAVVSPDDTGVDAVWTPAEIAARLAEAEALMEHDHAEAALLLLVAAAEAAGRRLADAEQVAVQRWHPRALFRQLVHVGLLDRAALPVLDHAVTMRNRLKHGIVPDGENGDISASAREVAAVVKQLVAEIARTASAEPGPTGSAL